MHTKTIFTFASGLLALTLSAGYMTFNMSVVEDSKTWKKERKEPDPDTPKGKKYFAHKKAEEEVNALPYEDAWITSYDGLKLHGRFYPNANAKRIAILCHGYHGSAAGDFSFILPMLKNDCEILAVDERSMGESEGKYITFGAKEKKDILLWASWMNERNEKQLPVYLYGVSMGAAAVLMNADQEIEGLKGIIADCGYTTMDRIIADVQKAWYKASLKPVRMALDFWCRILADFSMKEADALTPLANAKYPVLFFHGADDRFVPPYHTKMNAAACASEHKELFVENATHGSSAQMSPELYEKTLREFFAEHD